MKVLCFGSLNIDYVYTVPHFVQRGETLSADALHVFTGGKGLNQSIALARAGAEVWHAGAIGADGAFLVDALKEAGVRTEYIDTLPEVSTGHAIIQKSADGDNCILLYGGANQAVTPEQIDRTLECFSAGDLLLAQNEISALPHLLQRAKARGLRVALNPSPMDESLPPLLVLADCLLLNEIEASQLLGCGADSDPEIMLTQLHTRYPDAQIVLTLGAQGALCADGDCVIRQRAVPVQAVDTTAAGDTFTGFFLAGLLEGQGTAQAMRFAAAAAAIAVTQSGAAPSIPTRKKVLSSGAFCDILAEESP